MEEKSADKADGMEGNEKKLKEENEREVEGKVKVLDFECGICLSILVEPLSLSCGHTFCRTCLVASLKRNKKKCPTCRSVCHISAEDQPENVIISSIIRNCFPQLYQQRLVECQVEKESWLRSLPIFYYNVPMFPGEMLRLHLFEPRYKIMIQRVVSASKRFAYVPNYGNYRASRGDIALIAELQEVEIMNNGSANLEAKIISRCIIEEHWIEDGTAGLHYCRLLDMTDDPTPSEHTEALKEAFSKAIQSSKQLFQSQQIVCTMINDRFGEMPPEHKGPETFSLWLSAILPFPRAISGCPFMSSQLSVASIEDKDNLLKMKNTLQRLNILNQRMDQLLLNPRVTIAAHHSHLNLT